MTETTLHIIDSSKYFKGIINVLKKETKENKNVIYITTNKPYKYLIATLKNNKINTNNLLFIDCISKHIGEDTKNKGKKCIFIEGPESLTTMSIAINEIIKGLSGKKVLLLDSLSVLLIYNNA